MVKQEKSQVFISNLETSGKASLEGNGIWRVCLLVFLALALSNLSTLFNVLLFISPVPLAMGNLIYGKKVTQSLSAILLFVLATAGFWDATIVYVAICFFLTILFSLGVSYTIEQNKKVYEGISTIGALFSGVLWGVYFFLIFIQKIEMKVFLQEQLKETHKLLETSQGLKLTLAQLVDQVLTLMPVVFTLVPFLGVWVFFLLVLRNKRTWNAYQKYSYGVKEAMAFRTPYWLVYVFVGGLASGLGAHEYEFSSLQALSYALLSLCGVFYFFQGFGIFWETLNKLKVYGLFRSVLVIMVFFWAHIWIALVGLFDTWLDFRKFINKKNEGESI